MGRGQGREAGQDALDPAAPTPPRPIATQGTPTEAPAAEVGAARRPGPGAHPLPALRRGRGPQEPRGPPGAPERARWAWDAGAGGIRSWFCSPRPRPHLGPPGPVPAPCAHPSRVPPPGVPGRGAARGAGPEDREGNGGCPPPPLRCSGPRGGTPDLTPASRPPAANPQLRPGRHRVVRGAAAEGGGGLQAAQPAQEGEEEGQEGARRWAGRRGRQRGGQPWARPGPPPGLSDAPRLLAEGVLTLRSRPPSEAEFVDCFQKIKLAINLLVGLGDKSPLPFRGSPIPACVGATLAPMLETSSTCQEHTSVGSPARCYRPRPHGRDAPH